MKTKNLIIGAGPSGIVIAQRLAEKGQEVLLVEKRNHIGGNCYDFLDENGILIHKYGPHIFHTNFEDVWYYLNRFSNFTDFQHKVLGEVDGNLIPIPFNFLSIEKSFSKELSEKLKKTLLLYYNLDSKVSIVELREKAEETNNPDLKILADYIYEKVFKNYTVKQWGIKADDINEDVLKRVPVVVGDDDRYFPHNLYQGMPQNGYTHMFEKMLASEKIDILLNTDYKNIIDTLEYGRLFFTGPIDEFFGFCYGKLDYRKTEYKMETYDLQSFQENIVINYPNEHEYTRITEFKKFYPESKNYGVPKTVICKEIPGIGEIEAYPVETQENLRVLEKYMQEAKKLENVFFLGRLANFKYLDMDKTIKNALNFEI